MASYSRPSSQGEISLSRRELFATLSATQSTNWTLTPQNFPFLQRMGKIFELIRWHKVVIEFRPLVGATIGGSVAIGMDWGGQSLPAYDEDGRQHRAGYEAMTKETVMACTPCMDGPPWQGFRMSIPPSRLQTRAWYQIAEDAKDLFDYAPGSLAVVASCSTSPGEIWIDYSVTMMGTKPA